MVKKVIQVPVDAVLLKSLNSLSKKQGKARAEVIRESCVSYMAKAQEEEQDRIYREGYLRIPEEPDAGKAQASFLAKRLPRESW